MARSLSVRLGGVPLLVAGVIACAWALAIAAELNASNALLSHDALIEGGPATPVALALFLVAWVVMIAAMMVPSSLPLMVLFARASAGQPRPRVAMAALLTGYLLVWAAFGGFAFVADLGVHALVDHWGSAAGASWLVAPGVLALAGAFQFTSLKDRCLKQCRHPGAFILRWYERGAAGGMRVGLRHGAFCLGCCWALMLVAFAAGLASLPLMALLAAVMLHEKTRPSGRRTVPVTGTVLLGMAAVALAWSAHGAGVI